jgi:hypothetical protein
MSAINANPFDMTATNTEAGGAYELCEAGNYAGVLVGLIDLGTHSETNKEGRTDETRKVALFFELPGEMRSDGSPFVLGMKLSHFFSPKANLRKLFEGWRGKQFAEGEKFSLTAALLQPGLVNVVHKTTVKGKLVHEIEGVKPLPKGMTCGKPFHQPVVYAIGGTEPVPTHDWLPYLYGQHVSDYIAASREMREGSNGVTTPAAVIAAVSADEDDDRPPF